MDDPRAQEALHTDWYLLSRGSQFGPYSWHQLVDFVREGRVAPDDLVWHASMPGWKPATQIPGLPVAGLPRFGRSWWTRHRAVLLVGIPAAVAVIVVVILAAAGVFSKDRPPVIDTVMQGPTVIDVPVNEHDFIVTTEDGGRYELNGFALEVPGGAVDDVASLTVSEILEPFAVNQGEPPSGGGPHSVCLGPIVDLGPEGMMFNKPVTVSIPYDESQLPAGFCESDVVAAYWSGAAWVVAGGLVDTEKKTVTVRLDRFDGVAVTAIATVVGLGAVIVAEAVYFYRMWSNPEGVTSDPMYAKEAYKWINPDDPVVRDWASRAVFVDKSDETADEIPIDDPGIQAWAVAGRHFALGFKQADGTVLTLEGRYSAAQSTNWQQPADYFTKGDARGDCTDVTNALVSVLRNRHYKAKGVFGYDVSDGPHVWGETLIGGKPYLIDEDGVLWPLDDGMSRFKLHRADASDSRNAMWDEYGQWPYETRWWESGEPISSSSTTLDDPTAITLGPGDLPVEPDFTVESFTQVSKADDITDRRVFVTSTRTYDNVGNPRMAVKVSEYRYVDGELEDEASRWLFEADIPLGGGAGEVEEVLAQAAERIRRTMAEEGLVEGWLRY